MADHGVVGLNPSCLEYLYHRLDLVIENPGGAYDDIVKFTEVVKATVKKSEGDGTLDKAWTLVLGACKDLDEAEDFLAESTALLPHANGDWRIIDCMLSDYGAPAGTFRSAEEFLTAEPPKDYKKCYNTVWYSLYSRLTWSKPRPDSALFKEWDQEYISNLEAFWASMWNVNASCTFLKMLDTGAPEYEKDENIQRIVAGGYKVVKTFLDQDRLFSITRTDVDSDQLWIVEDFAHKSFMGGESDEDKVVLLNSDLTTLRQMQNLVRLTGQPTVVAALIIKGLFTKDRILALTEDEFVHIVTSLPHAPVSYALAHKIYQTLGSSDHDANIESEVKAGPFKKARRRDLTDPANPAALTSLDPNMGPVSSHPQHATVKDLVGGGDLITLDDGLTTITSPSAYFVDLLELLKQTTATHVGPDGHLARIALFDLLVDRRPDLPYLQLSIENTNIAMPYLDLVNEVMTQVIFAKDPSSETPPVYYDTKFGEQSKDLLAQPLHMDYNVYRLISGTVPIGSLPYDPHLHRMRVLLRAMGTSLLDLMLNFPSKESHLGFEALLTDDRERLTHTEFLQISDQEVRLIISGKPSGPETVKKLWGFPYSATQAVLLEKLSLVEDEVLPRASIELSDLAQILKTNYINPGAMRENGNFNEDISLNPGPLVIIDSSDDDGPPGLSSKLRLLRRDSTSPTWDQLHKLMIFIRVWKHINALSSSSNWTVDNLDHALTLLPDPSGKDFDLVLSRIDSVSQISALTGLDISRVLVLFGNLSMPLYREIFVRHDLAAKDSVFEWNQTTGMYLGDNSIKVADHLLVVLAALRISSKEFALIIAHLGTSTSDTLNFTTLSSYLRTIFIRDAFGIELRDLKTLDQFRGVFGTPKNTSTDFLKALKKWQRLTTQVFSIGEGIFIATGQDPDKLGPDSKLVVSMAGTLGSQLSLIDSQYPDIIEDDEATSDAVSQYASPLFGPQFSKNIVNFLEGKRVVRIPIEPSAIPTSFKDTTKLKVSREDGLLIVTGILTDKELRDALSQGRQPGWRKALDSIRNLARDFYHSTMGDMLDGLPDPSELEGFFLQGDDVDSGTAQLKRAMFLEVFIPLLRKRLVARSVREFVDSGALQGMAPDAIRMILAKFPPDPQTPGAVAEQTIEEKLMAIRSDVYDSSEPFEGHLIPASTDSYRFVADAGSGSNLSVTIDKTTYTFKPQFDKSQFFVTDAVALTGSQIYEFSATSGIEGLQWRALQNRQQSIPIDALIKSSTSEDLRTNLSWLTRFRMLMDRLHLDSREVMALDTRLTWDFIDYMMSYVDLRAYIVSQQEKTTESNVAQKLLSVFPLRIDPLNEPRYSATEISNATGWPLGDIRPYASFTAMDKVTWRGVLQIKSQISICKNLGVLVDDVYLWVSGRATDTFDDKWERADELTLLYNHSSRTSHTQWEETAASTVYDELRDNHRKALVAFLLQQTWLKDVQDVDALFEYLLIDTQMGAGLETSRTKQAISTVQLFLQRCLLGLEDRGTLRITNVESFIQKWNWMSKYRVWEANRKVFIFPENWIDPAFRDDKSSAFEAFESNLIKSPLTQEHITRAVLDYVHDAYEVRSLSIEATYTKRGPTVDGKPGPIKHIHYIGRTVSTPYTFYHRIFAHKAGTWTPWRKIDTQIPVIENDPDGRPLYRPGSYIIPYEFQGRLLLILPQLLVKNKKYDGQNGGVTVTSKDGTTTLSPPKAGGVQKYWEIKLAWTEYRNNKWSPKVLCQSTIECQDAALPTIDSFNFLVGLPSEILDVHKYEDNLIRSVLEKSTGEETFSVWIDHFYHGHVGAFMWQNGGLESFKTEKYQMGDRDGYTFFTTFHKNIPQGRQDLCVFETSYLCRNFTVSSLSYTYDESPLRSPDAADARTMNSDYCYQFRNVLVPRLMSMLDTKGVFGAIAEFGANIGSSEVETERIEVFGGTRVGQGGGSLPHELRTPVAIYNWELGFHIPAMIMERAMAAQQYDIALEYARYVLDPRPADGQTSYWKWPPFAEFNPASSTVTDTTTIEEWKLNPFQPHVIARGRPLAYKKWVVMKYVEILIAYGDSYFRQNTLETIPMAIQLYIEAAHIFGPRAQNAPEIGGTQTDRYGDLESFTFDALSNLKVEMEYVFPFAATNESMYDDDTIIPLGTASSEYFKYYSNPKMIEMRALVDDRLMKIRNSMDINGAKRKLALFEPALDPGALVAAMARSGASLSSILNSMDSPMPNCRLRHILPTALRLCHELKHLSFRYIKIKERADAEELAALKASQHTAVQHILTEMQSMEIKVAKKKLEVAEDDIDAPRMRLKYYRQLLGISDLNSLQETPQMIQQPSESDDLRRTPLDEAEESNRLTAVVLTQAGESLVAVTGLMFLMPGFSEMIQPFGMGAEIKFDAKNVGKGIKYAAKVMKVVAKVAEFKAKEAERAGELTRRRQENTLEANEAVYEIKNMQLKIKAEESKIAAAEHKLESHKKFVEHALEVEDFLRSKYTNKELYTWLDSTYKNFHYQSYNLAYDIAKRAEKAYQFETGDDSVNFIQYGYWDDGRNGLGCAEGLYLDLKKLEQAQLTSRPYDFEIIKNVSLRELQPLQLLLLREIGSAIFDIPELAYDLDFPGHYFRRLKAVSVTVLCAVVPNTGVCCTLKLLENKYRTKSTVRNASQYAQQVPDAFRSDKIPVESIAISSGVSDSGTFQLDFDGEHFVPFEGAGAISKWSLEFPTDFRHFDYETITDVVLEIKYTSKGAGGMLKTSAVAAAQTVLKDASNGGLIALLDLRNDFPEEWATFTASQSSDHILDLANLKSKLPFFAQIKKSLSTNVSLLTTDTNVDGSELKLQGGRGSGLQFNGGSLDHGSDLRRFDLDFQNEIKAGWKLTYSYSGQRQPLEMMWMVVEYHLG